MKWLFAILAVVLGGAVGWIFSQRRKRREVILGKLYTMCDIVSNNLQFAREPMVKILETAEQDSPDLKRLFAAYRDNLDDAEQQRKKTSEVARCCSLSAAEADAVSEFFGILGKSDAQSQISGIAHYKTMFGGFREEAHAEWKKTGSLYWKLGLLIGAGVAILIL